MCRGQVTLLSAASVAGPLLAGPIIVGVIAAHRAPAGGAACGWLSGPEFSGACGVEVNEGTTGVPPSAVQRKRSGYLAAPAALVCLQKGTVIAIGVVLHKPSSF